MTTALVIHGHFYQPPRENPWTELIDREPGAEPFHDWNERINSECYRPNAHARITDSYGRVERIVNNYAGLSFNFGPTLLSWLERSSPDTYARIVEADRESVRRRGGHGNAIAQGYDHATLDTLIEEGLRYVILSPFQAARVRALGAGEHAWRDVSGGDVDTTVPYLYYHSDGGGRSLAVFFYDGQIARGVAFEGLLASSRAFVGACARAARHGASLVNVATDGESYGHHFRFGDRCLAYALDTEAARQGFRVTNYGEFLDTHEPAFEVEIRQGPDGEGTAWSCAHGLGRWTRDCGCNAGAPEGWNQRWRTPLRAAFDLLRDDLAPKFEEACGRLLRDPWEARDAYVELLGPGGAARREEFLSRHVGRPLDADEKVLALTLL